MEETYRKEAWECPRCHQVNSYLKMTCDCPPQTFTSTTVTQQQDQPVTAKTEQETKCSLCKDEHWINTHEGRVSEPCPACGGGERYKEQETNEQPKRVSAEKFKNKIYDKIRDDLKDARMEGWNTDDEDKYPLLDFLSKGNTIEGGLSEIDNIVEQIDIDDLIERFVSQHPEQEKPQIPHGVLIGLQHDISNVLKEQEKPSEQSAEECTIEEEKMLILFAKHVNIFHNPSLRLPAIPCMSRSAFIAAIKEFASQKHPVTDDMISAKLDTVNFETSKERETAFDLLVWMRDKLNNKEI